VDSLIWAKTPRYRRFVIVGVVGENTHNEQSDDQDD
jgi:hypothetical protein